jgi:acetyl-CoA carboxylase carboxyltransferase component
MAAPWARPAPFLSAVDPTAAKYKENLAGMSELCATLEKRSATTMQEGAPRSIEKHRSRGQLLGRERVALLLDEDSPFLELGLFMGFGNKTTPKTGVCGIGLVCGVETMILADCPTVRGAAKNAASVEAGLRALQISIENRLPLVNLIQTAGADLTQQDKVFHKGGITFRLIAQRSKMCLPTISVVFGSSTAGGAYHPGMSDYVVMIRRHAKVYLGGPPLVRMATGEDVSHEVLGGAAMHSTLSGVSDYLAENEPHALRIARNIIASLDTAATKAAKATLPTSLTVVDEISARSASFSSSAAAVEEPLYSADELLGIISPAVKNPFDMHEVIARIVDGSRMNLFKPNYGKTLVCCWAEIYGYRVGILANNGVLFSDSSQKGAQFIALCNQKNCPILFFHNITGFMVGSQSEHGGLIKHGSLLVNAVSNSRVPHLSVIMGASFGAGNYAMCGRAYNPRFLFSFPNAKCSVMGAEQLAGVLDHVTGERRRGAEAQLAELKELGEDEMAKDLQTKVEQMTSEAKARNTKFQQQVEAQMDAYATSAQGLDDGIIDPRDTRTILGLCLSIVSCAPVRGGNVAGVSRL